MFDYSTKPLHLLMSELLDKIAAKDFQDVGVEFLSTFFCFFYLFIRKKWLACDKQQF